MATDLRASEAAIVGAGVIGLTTAVTLLERGILCTVYAERRTGAPEASPSSGKHGAPPLSSAAAPAVFTPFAGADPERLARWIRTSFARYADLAAREPAAGVRMTELREYLYKAPRETPLAELLQERPIVPKPAGLAAASTSIRPHVLTARFLPWLERRVLELGGRLVFRRVNDLADVFAQGHRVVVNGAGVGARALAADQRVRPIAGQVVHVPNTIGLTYSLHDDAPNDRVAYIFAYDDRLVLGSTNLEGEWTARVDPDEERAIIERCRGLLKLDGHPRWNDLARGVDTAGGVVARFAGLRPARGGAGVSEDPRVEAVPAGDGRTVVHHYGHGRSGVTLAWGTAAEAADLVIAGLR